MPHEAPNDQPLIARGSVLSDYLDRTAHSTDSLSHFNNTMSRLLADRLTAQGDGVGPGGYIRATELLLHDSQQSGMNGISDEPMPRDVTNQPPMMYGMFLARSIKLAGEAFGPHFEDAVAKIYLEQMKKRDTERLAKEQAHE